MAAIQIPPVIIRERLSKLEHDLESANIIKKEFDKTRELGFLFDLSKLTKGFYTNEYYLLRTQLDPVQNKTLKVLLRNFETINYFVDMEIHKLSKCKV